MPTSTLAPGLRVLIRDTEWLIRRVDTTDTGGRALSVVGISEIVRNREAIFIEEAEETIDVLDPAETKLVPDLSNAFLASKLYLESLLRQRPPTSEDICIGHKAAMDLLPFQLKPAKLALDRPRQRILIADAVGLGKTLEAGILLAELIKRGKAKRILVVAIKSMLTQFQKEMWSRFTIPLVRLDSIGLQRVRSRIPTHQNPFYYYDRSIISIDTLKQDNEFRHYLENAYWDVIVIDEAHNVALRGGSRSQRAEIAQMLAQRSDSLIMLSATPHDGKRESFASLMNMLDPTAIADPSNYTKDDIKGLYQRRFKKDIQQEAGAAFPKRTIQKITGPAAPSQEEENALDKLVNLTFSHIDQKKSGGLLFKVTLEKALFSSPAACAETIENRLKNIDAGTAAGDNRDRELLLNLLAAVNGIEPAHFSKYQNLLKLIKDTMKWKPTRTDDRLVIFTERIATLHFLKVHLAKDLALKEEQIELLHGGGLSDIEQQRIVEDFGKEKAPVRLMLASDVASEGINLHYLSHRMIHFDIPWSLMVFAQRNGRIDRYGQLQRPQIYYLMTETAYAGIKGDLRVLELLIDKDEEAQDSIGDPSALLDKFDQDEEEIIVAQAMGTEEKELWLEKQMAAIDPFDILIGTGSDDKKEADYAKTVDLPGLYADDFEYAQSALSYFQHMGEYIQFDIDKSKQEILLTLTEELETRFHFLPREIHPGDKQLCLSADPDKIKKEIEAARKEESAWPQRHYLWALNPVMEWLNDRMLSAFGRHEAPVIRLGSIKHNEVIVLLSGLIPNRQGHPLVHEWFGVHFVNSIGTGVMEFEELLNVSGFNRKALPNRNCEQLDTSIYAALLKQAVTTGNEHVGVCRKKFLEKYLPRVEEKLAELDMLRGKHQQQYELDLEQNRIGTGTTKTKRERRKRQIEQAFTDYGNWINNTMKLEEQAHLQVLAVFAGE